MSSMAVIRVHANVSFCGHAGPVSTLSDAARIVAQLREAKDRGGGWGASPIRISVGTLEDAHG